ncbi:hypothetical protein NQ317_004425 [Molorchus minor]|uniref:Transposase n=1 Tax=Molorchus minor TaxID=1323400 RepID=A0ABQ9J6E2_9CUCU|nr:hypothetical protein NQ317_004425 [Molorchus minor]
MVRRFSRAERIEIFIKRDCSERQRTLVEMFIYFNNNYPLAEPLLKTSVSKIIKTYEDLGHVRDRPKSGRPAVPEDVDLKVLLELQENPHLPSKAVAANNEISQETVLHKLKRHKWHPYKVNLVHGLNEDDFDRRVQFSEKKSLYHRILFNDEATLYLNGTSV